MANVAKNAILRAKIAGVMTDLMPRSVTDNIYVNADTTLTQFLNTLAKQADLTTLQQTVEALGALAQKDKVSQADLDEALAALIAGKAEQSALDEVSGKVTTLVGEDAGKSVRTIANEELTKQLVPEAAQESLDTLAEIAAWIQAHPGDAAAMNAAIEALQVKVDTGDQTVSAYVAAAIAALNIGDYAKAADLTALAARVEKNEGDIASLQNDKADKATTLAGYGITDAYTETEVDQKIADAVRNATGGESAASVLAELNAYKTSNNSRVEELEAKKHEHANKDVLDGITADVVTGWNGKSKIFYTPDADGEPAGMAEGDLWVALVD